MVVRPKRRLKGFSLLELMVVVAIIMIVAAIGVPNVIRAIRTARIRGTAVEYANLLQNTRVRAINDDRFYSVYVQPPAGGNSAIAYADVYPMALNGRSGLGPPPTGRYNPGPPSDPMTTLSLGVLPQPVASAPDVAALNAAFCVSCTPDLILNAAPTWGPDGMPCLSKPSLDGTGTVCNSSGGPVAYVTYFQSTVSQQWSAVTVSPAGRVKAWHHEANGGGWSPQ
jgi:prepilin-type N-terminal cleavage/methylation domain-containing protein